MSHCPTPRKQALTHAQAETNLAAMRRNPRILSRQLHVYRCECGAWHIGGKKRRARTKPKGSW